MASYKIEWKKSAIRELRNLPREIIPRIISAVGELSSNPFPDAVKKLSGAEHTYRIRIGLIEYFEFTLNLGMLAAIGGKTPSNEDLDRTLRACFLPWYLDARSSQRAVNEWYLAVQKEPKWLQNHDLPERSDPSVEADELGLFNSTISSFSFSSERLPSESFHKSGTGNLAFAV